MTTLHKLFKYNNISYVELKDEEAKKKIDSMIFEIEKSELREQTLNLLEHNPDYDICIRCGECLVTSNLPQDLQGKILHLIERYI